MRCDVYSLPTDIILPPEELNRFLSSNFGDSEKILRSLVVATFEKEQESKNKKPNKGLLYYAMMRDGWEIEQESGVDYYVHRFHY